MISIFPADATDFSSNGLCALAPSSCLVNETLNGEWELQLVHPLDTQDKWSWLQVGSIVKAPVPAAITPRVKLLQQSEGKDIYRVRTFHGGLLNLWSRATRSSPSLAKYKTGQEVQVISTANPDFFEVIAPDGKRGWMGSEYLVFVRTEITNVTATGQIVAPRQLRDQPFRIYCIVPELTQVTAYARHLSYDLMDNMIYQYKPAKGTAGAIVAEGIFNGCQTAHSFQMYSDLTQGVEDLSFENTNPMEALLGEGGLIDKVGGELARDWYDLYAVKRVGKETDIQIRQGKNLLGISYDVDDANVVTRIVPTGENEDGSVLLLDEKYIDSPNIGAYPHPRWIHLPVGDAKVGDDLSLAQAKDKLRAAARAEFDKGCDLPDISIDVDFINVADTQEYADYKPLTDIFLGDSVRVIVRTLGLEVALRMTEYSYDCLLRRYAKMTLGMASETIAGSMISPRQLPAGGIKGMKLAMGSIGTGHLQTMSIGSLQVKTAAIGSAHIQNAAIDTAHIKDASIETAKIKDAQITNAKIATATIQTANIADAAITNAKIGTAAIQTANIADAAITNAKIGSAAIQSAHITDASITNAKIGLAAIDTANIIDAAITSAKIGLAQIKNANIEDAAITNAKIGTAAITSAKIGFGEITNALIADAAITSAKIGIAAITSAKIEDAAITNAKIALAAIDTANIADAAITTAKIGLAAIQSANIALAVIASAHIQDAAISNAKISDAAITNAKIDNAAVTSIKIQNGTIEAINIADAAIESAKIKDAAIVTAKIADAAIDSAKIADLAVGSAKIAAAAITEAKIGDLAVTNAKIGNAAIDAVKISEAAVDSIHIGEGSVDSINIADAAIINTKIGQAAIASANIQAGAIQEAHIGDAQITSAKIALAAIGSAQIQNAAITNALIAQEAVNTAQIADGSITDAKIVALTANKINAGELSVERLIIAGSDRSIVYALNNMGALTSQSISSLDGDTLTPRSITADKLVAKSITSDEIAARSITANEILAGSLTGNEIAGQTITAQNIQSGTITVDKVSSSFASSLDLSSNESITLHVVNPLNEALAAKANASALDGLLTQAHLDEVLETELAVVNGSITTKFTEAKAAGTSASSALNAFRETVESWQQFSPTGLTLGRSDSPYKVVLSNEKLSFLQDNAEIAYISNNKLYITASEIVNQFVIGGPTEGYMTMDVIDGGLTATWRAS